MKATRVGMSIVALLMALPASAQMSTVPAVPGATSGRTPEEVQAQIKRTNEQLAALQASINSAALQQGKTSQQMGLPPANGPADGTVVPPWTGPVPGRKPVPQTPSVEEVRRLELQLARAKSQRRAETIAEGGIIGAVSASAMRSKVIFPYIENSIYEIFTAPDRMTSIELEPGEVISTENGKPKAADTVQWVADTVTAGEGAMRKTIITIKPVTSGLETNMLVPTNRHVYSLLLRSESRAYMPLVAFSYPPDEARTPEASAQVLAKESSHETVSVAPEEMNFGYRVKGKKRVVWEPIRVFDDGTKTYLQMAPQVKSWESPALFVIEEKSAPQLVNYRVKGDYYIVDRLFHQAQLRVGTNRVVTIYRDPQAGG